MPCCGTPRDEPVEEKSGLRSEQQAPVEVQPGMHPNMSMEKDMNPVMNIYPPPASHSPPTPARSPHDSFMHKTPSPMPQSPRSFNGAPGLVRPEPVYTPWSAGTPTMSTFVTPSQSGAEPMDMSPPITGESSGKMSISVDFGTTFSGVAYGSSRIASGQVQQILNWPGSSETFRKVPTCLLYDEHGSVIAWGLPAKQAANIGPGQTKCEWFKLFLEPKTLRDQSEVDPRLPPLPRGKQPLDVIVDFLTCLWEYAKERITAEIGAVADLDSADVWLTVPAAWDAKGCELMRDAAIRAGLVQSARAGDYNWRERLRIITEPEAAAVHCVQMTDLHRLKPSQTFMICDAGGGTVDLAVYKIIGSLAGLEIAEMCARSGANCGSLFLDLRFRELVKTLLADHPLHLDPASLAYFMHSFSEAEKLAYQGTIDDGVMFNFNCFQVEDLDDPSVGLINGELAIPGNLLRREVFDPVVEEVLGLIEEQLKRVTSVDALLLVGGFATSEYLFHRVDEKFGSRIKVIARPHDADTATLRGAAQYGLAQRALVSSIIAPRAYMMKVKLPAEPEDFLKRPAYISTNAVGMPICENRLQYLVAKNAILRKGQVVKTKFTKFSQSAQDRTFVATLYTSERDEIMRYTDEGETTVLCQWHVDLGVLPSFQENASMSRPSGFYTDFELGLELDSAEVRGILLYEGQEWGRVVFDFFH